MRRLTELRVSKNYSKTTVAHAIGITRQAYANYENDTRTPPVETLKKLADFFCVSVNDLIDNQPLENLVYIGSPHSAVVNQIIALVEQLPSTRQLHYRQMLENEIKFLNDEYPLR